ncbi:hypothetical protein EDB83DRAFT_2322081 [Lactarius deliciosus]|nr:hypothetical protein EDB83DRAFT_2322081 [Lactarius deliciosus]
MPDRTRPFCEPPLAAEARLRLGEPVWVFPPLTFSVPRQTLTISITIVTPRVTTKPPVPAPRLLRNQGENGAYVARRRCRQRAVKRGAGRYVYVAAHARHTRVPMPGTSWRAGKQQPMVGSMQSLTILQDRFVRVISTLRWPSGEENDVKTGECGDRTISEHWGMLGSQRTRVADQRASDPWAPSRLVESQSTHTYVNSVFTIGFRVFQNRKTPKNPKNPETKSTTYCSRPKVIRLVISPRIKPMADLFSGIHIASATAESTIKHHAFSPQTSPNSRFYST